MLARRNRVRWSILVAVLGVLPLVISAGWLALVWIHDGVTVANAQASASAFLLAAAVAGAALFGWVRSRRAAAVAPVTAEQVGQASATLAEVVAEQWAQEARARLGDPEPMPVRWRLSATASGIPVMDHPEVIATAGLTFAGSSDQITELVAAFHRLDRRRFLGSNGQRDTGLTWSEGS